MIIDKKIKITVNPTTRQYYNNIGYDCKNYDIIEINVNELLPGSNIKVLTKCDICGYISSIRYVAYIKNTKNYTQLFTCKKCSSFKVKKTKLLKYGNENYINIEKSKKTKLLKYGNENYTNREKSVATCLEKYGVDNVSKFDEVKEAKKRTSLENWGVDNVFKSEEIKNRIINTVRSKYKCDHYVISDECREKYNIFCDNLGVDHYSKSDEYKNKFKETCLNRWGEVTNLLNPMIKDKIKQTNIIKYGFDIAMRNNDIAMLCKKSLIENRANFFKKYNYEFISYDYENKLYKLKNLNCGHIFDINYDLFRSRIKYQNDSCLVCYPKNELSSIKEKELVNWLRLYNIEIIENDRNLIKKEIDIYLPEFKIGIEFNGLYYHSDKFKEKNYHSDKTKKCKEIGIHLIHIWEDDWIYKQNIIKSIILNKLGKIENKIWARKCVVKVIEAKEAKEFLEKNHIQGNSQSKIKLGLFYENELVSLMTFGNRRLNSKDSMELIRFCNKINTNVVGSASKLFKYFIKNYKCDKIISYSDNSLFNGNLYENLGFTNDGETNLNYYWTNLNNRYHRFTFNKKKLIKMGYDANLTEDEIMHNIGFYKIWSCGQIRWIFKKLV